MPTTAPRISIVTPSYNQVAFLEETIQSILSQNYPNLEYIVIDGDSTDGSLDIIQKYADHLAYWVSEPDRGQSHAINKGFEKCTGDIVTFCNSDDIYFPGTFQHVADLWGQWQDYGALIGAFQYMDEHSQLVGVPRPPKLTHPGPIDLTLSPPGTYRLHQVSTFFNRRALDDVGRWVREDMKYVLDRELLYRVLRKYTAYLVDRPFGVFRLHQDSKSVSQIIPFAEEFKRLYLMQQTSNPREDRLRQRMARYHLSRGYIKYARSSEQRADACKALIKAAIINPVLIWRINYIWYWFQILGLRKRREELISESVAGTT